MAIRKDHTHDTILYSNAYIRIERFDFGNKVDSTKIAMHCWAGIYADKPSVDQRPICTTDVAFEYDINSTDNLLKQAYAGMKIMPEWQDAVDDI